MCISPSTSIANLRAGQLKIKPEIQELKQGSEEKLKVLEKLDPVGIQIQAALTVIGRRDSDKDYTSDKASEVNTKRLDLGNSYLRSAYLFRIENLSDKQIKSACFWEKAIYTDGEWDETQEKWIVVDEKANQKRIEEIKQDKASDPVDPPDCSIWHWSQVKKKSK